MALSTVNDNEPLSKYNPTGLLTFAGGKKNTTILNAKTDCIQSGTTHSHEQYISLSIQTCLTYSTQFLFCYYQFVSTRTLKETYYVPFLKYVT